MNSAAVCVHHYLEQRTQLPCSFVTLLSSPFLTTFCSPMLCSQVADSHELQTGSSAYKVSRRVHTVEEIIKSPRSRERRETRDFAPISLAAALITPWCLFLPGSLFSEVANPTGQLDSATFSTVLGFQQLLNSELPYILRFFTLSTPLQLFPCIKFPFLDYLV